MTLPGDSQDSDANGHEERRAHPRVPWIMKDPLTEYTFAKELGAGHYGTTYQIHRNSDGQEFACKVINKLQRHCRFKDIMREVEIQRALIDCPYVCKLYEVWEWQSYVYLIEELCHGGELFDVIIARGHMSEQDAASIVRVILEVVKACHTANILHRDLKPENYLFRHTVLPDGQPLRAEDLRAIDFGLSLFLEPGERRREMAGSSYYMAPEVLQRNYSYPADLWSVGVITYILPPFWGNTDHVIYERIRYEPLDMKVEPLPELSKDVHRFLRGLLNRDESERLTVDQALAHPWVTSNTRSTGPPLSRVVVTRLKRFTATTKLKHVLMHVVAQHLSDEAIGNLKSMFQRLDKDSSGSVSYEDMEAAFREAGMELDRDQVQEMCSRLDLSQCGRLDYATFVAAAIDKKRVLTDRTLATIFAELDLDGDGLLGAAELHAAAVEAGVDIDEDTLLDLLQREGAVNAEGLIHPDAFQRLMASLVAADLGPAALDGFLAGCRRFARGCHFRQLALHVIATRLDPTNLTDLHDLFTAMDVDGCGRVTFSQLYAAMDEAGYRMAEEELGLLFDALDIDHDGLLQYTDFLAAALEHQAVLTDARVRAAFEFFDADGDGVISLSELRRALTDLMMDPDEAETLLREADTNHDHVIDFGEFHALLCAGGPTLCTSASLRLSHMSRSTNPQTPNDMSPQASLRSRSFFGGTGRTSMLSAVPSSLPAGSMLLRNGQLSFPGRSAMLAGVSVRGASFTLASPAGREAFANALRRKTGASSMKSPRVAPSRSNTNLQALDGPRATLGFDAPPLTGLRVSRSSASLSSLRGRGRGGETPPATPMVVAAAAARLGRSVTDMQQLVQPQAPLRRTVSLRESSRSSTTLPSYNPSMVSLRGMLQGAQAQGPTAALQSRELARHDAAQVVSMALARSQSQGGGQGVPIPRASVTPATQRPVLASIDARKGDVEEELPPSPVAALVCEMDERWRKGCMSHVQ